MMSNNATAEPLATFRLRKSSLFVGFFIVSLGMMALLMGTNSRWHFGLAETVALLAGSTTIAALFAGLSSVYLTVKVFPEGIGPYEGPMIPWCQIASVKLMAFVPGLRVIEVRQGGERGLFVWIPLSLNGFDQLVEVVCRQTGDVHPLAELLIRIQGGDTPRPHNRFGAMFVLLWFTGILVAAAFFLRDKTTEGYVEMRSSPKDATAYRFDIPPGWYANYSRSRQGYRNVLVYDANWMPRIGVQLAGEVPADRRTGELVGRVPTDLGEVELRREIRDEFGWSWLMPKAENPKGGVIWTAHGDHWSLQWSTTAAWEADLRPIVDRGLRSLRSVSGPRSGPAAATSD